MDREYLQNIANSPHIEEGLGDRILARGSSGLQRVSAMTGGNIDDLNYKKVSTLFNSFIKKISTVLKDFAEGDHSVANRLEQMRPPITPVQRDTIQQIRDLYSSLIPSPFQQNQLGQSILNPRKSGLGEMLREGIFTRDMGVNKALQSNNPTTILNAYINEVKKAYDSFVRDAMKVTGTPRDYVKRVVGNFDKKWAPILNKVEGVINSVNTQPAGQPATNNPTGTSSAASTDDTSPMVPSDQEPIEEPVPELKTSEEDFVLIVMQVSDVIIKAVKGDVERAAPYFKPGEKEGEYEPLPADWDAPAITKEIEEPDVEPDPAHVKNAPEGERNEFLYNFHSLYRKQRHFAIEIPQSTPLTYTNRVKKQLNKLDVFWSNNSHENNIYVKHTPVKMDADQKDVMVPAGKAGDVLIFKFGDDQVNPRNPQGNQFSIQRLLDQANKNSKIILGKVSKSNPQLILQLNKRQDSLQRALYATVSRKRMEFKPKKAVSIQMKDGKAYYKGNAVDKSDIKQKLFSSSIIEATNWLEALDSIDYFEFNPDMKADRNKADAILQMVKQDVLHSDAIQAVTKASANQDIAQIPVNTLITLAKQELLKQDALPQNAQDALKVLFTLGDKDNKDSYERMRAVVSQLGTDSSVKDYVAAFKAEPNKNPVTTTTNSLTAPSKVSAPVTAPVSKPVTAPVSSEKPKPEKAKNNSPVSISDDGVISGIDPKSNQAKTWKIGQMIPSTISKAIMSDASLKKKFEDLVAKRAAAKAAKLGGNKPDLEEDIINPFSLANFL